LTVSNPYTQKPTLQTSTPQTSGKATAALVLGLLSLIFNCFTALPAMIVGVMAVGEINRSQGRLTGKGMAFAGIIVSAISMLATVGIVILIAVVLGPAFGEARTAAQIVHESNNMKQVGLAMHNYHDAHKSFPSVGTKEVPLSWRVSILPFLEGNALHDQFDFSQPADSAHNAAVGSQMPEVYGTELFAHGPNQSPLQIPFVAGAAELPPVPQSQVSIQASMGAPGKGVRSAAMRDILDGTSNTVMAVLARPETLR
jgi:type II secretory pathway pseudopilin PulG